MISLDRDSDPIAIGTLAWHEDDLVVVQAFHSASENSYTYDVTPVGACTEENMIRNVRCHRVRV